MDGKKCRCSVAPREKSVNNKAKRIPAGMPFSAFCGRTKTIAQVETHKIQNLRLDKSRAERL